MKAKLCILSVLFFVSSLIALLPVSSASAWQGSLNSCSFTLPSDWKSLIVAEDSATFSSVNFDTQQIVAGHLNSNSAGIISIFITPPTGTSKFQTVSGNNVYTFDGSYGKYANIYTPTYEPDPIYMTAGSVSGNKDFDCIVGTQNPVYANGYQYSETETLPDGISDNSCNAIDVPCHLVNIFVPRSDIMSTTFDDLSDIFTEKLGFLTYPPEFFAGLFGAMTSTANDAPFNTYVSGSGAPVMTLPFSGTFFGVEDGVKLDLSFFNSVPNVMDLLRLIMVSTIVVTLMIAFHRKYIEVVKT